MSKHKGFREESKMEYGQSRGGSSTLEEINAGSLMRMADSMEVIAKDRVKLERDYFYMRNDRDYHKEAANTARRSAAALKGVIARMKRKAQAGKVWN
jgi:hypothetical protein